jgi:hypothetical protein
MGRRKAAVHVRNNIDECSELVHVLTFELHGEYVVGNDKCNPSYAETTNRA